MNGIIITAVCVIIGNFLYQAMTDSNYGMATERSYYQVVMIILVIIFNKDNIKF